jgi:integrase
VVGTVVGMGKLTARQVATLGPGYHLDGDGLYLQVTDTGARSWIMRYQRGGRRREMGLGPVSLYGLAEARQRALQQRRLLSEGIDPIEARIAARRVTARIWGDASNDFIATHEPGWKGKAQAEQWRNSLKDYGPDPAMPIDKLDTAAVLDVLRPIWTTKTETATRVRGRIERIWSAEKVAGNVAGDNPARWRGHLDALLPKPSKVSKPQHHAAMPYTAMPAFMLRLRSRAGLSARAMEFVILTAARTGEATGMQWAELEGDVWTIPGERMKSGRPHNVPLSARALEILAALPRSKPPFPLSENAMLYLLQREPPKGLGEPYTVHGFRSSFRDWTAEETDTPRDVAEMALAHTIPNKAEAAYRRGHLLDKRRALMDAWAAYLTATPA